MGNTCFMNSVLQCLTYTPPLNNYFSQNMHICNSNGFCLACAMQEHTKKSFSSQVITPKPFIQNLKKIAKHFRFGRQEDSHEFLRFLVDGIHDVMAGKKKPKDKDNTKTIIKDTFGGALQSQVKCTACHSISNTNDPLMDICLDIKKCSTLEQAFQRFTTVETLSGSNKYKCEKYSLFNKM